MIFSRTSMKFLAAAAFAAVASAGHSAAVARTPESISQAAIAELKAGHYRKAVFDFFGNSELAAKKSDGLNNLADQIENAVVIYGPIRSCEIVDTAKRGTMIEVHLYLCQHDDFVSRWRFHMMRTQTGWTGMNFSFDDKIMLPITEPPI